MPDQQPTVQSSVLQGGQPQQASEQPPQEEAYDGFDEEEWLEDPVQLPPRPRRRLLGVGGNPLALALLGVLLTACGFIGGVLVEKGETSSSSSSAGAASSLASRFAALRGASSTGAARSGASAGASGLFGGGAAGAGRPTAGTVAYLSGHTLYVTNSEGNTIKVETSAATSVHKTVSSSVKAIRPGETVTITGSTGSNGAVSAESISVGSSGGGLAALFGATGARAGGAGGASALFGSGG
ncbi:MAG TPA: hypothetical protein VL979_00675 [Solirubrobacteraceae bacterium]|nr:hypothetical protein [Solirubrobacteraceae bacterium]